MSKITAIAIAILCSINANTQSVDTVYFNKKWEFVDQNDHFFYRTIHHNDSGAIIRNYYKNGNLQMKGFEYDKYHATNPNGSLYSGLFTWYDIKGRISKVYIYEAYKYQGVVNNYSMENKEINIDIHQDLLYMIFYHKNGNVRLEGYAELCEDCDLCKRQGRWFHFSKNGKFNESADFTDGLQNGESCWYMDGQLNNKWIYVDDVKHGDYWKYYLISGKLKKRGQYTNGEKSGVWWTYDKQGELKKTKTYK